MTNEDAPKTAGLDDRWFTIREAAERLGMSEDHFRRVCDRFGIRLAAFSSRGHRIAASDLALLCRLAKEARS